MGEICQKYVRQRCEKCRRKTTHVQVEHGLECLRCGKISGNQMKLFEKREGHVYGCDMQELQISTA